MGEGPRVPGFQVTKVNSNMATFVKRIVVDYLSDGPDMFEVEFVNKHAEEQQKPTFTHASGMFAGDFKEGDEITIQLGYDSKMTKMMVGEISNVDASFREHDSARFTIRGFDKLHRLSRGRKQRTFMSMKDSDIASQIAGEHGLSPEVDDSGTVHDHVFQPNLSDMDFLFSRAKPINFEVDCEDSKLIFKKPQVAAGPVGTYEYQKNLRRARFNISTSAQVSEVQVRGWSPKEKKEIVGKAKAADVYSKMGGDKAGGEVATGKYGQGQIVSVISNSPLASQEEADAMAKARLNELSLNFITGEAEVEGDAVIKSNKLIQFVGVGKKYEGLYYVVNATHILKPGNGPGCGYTTRFSFRRAGAKQM